MLYFIVKFIINLFFTIYFIIQKIFLFFYIRIFNLKMKAKILTQKRFYSSSLILFVDPKKILNMCSYNIYQYQKKYLVLRLKRNKKYKHIMFYEVTDHPNIVVSAEDLSNSKKYVVIKGITTKDIDAVKLAEPGELHHTSAVYLHNEGEIHEIKNYDDVLDAKETLTDNKLNEDYTTKFNLDKKRIEFVNENLEEFAKERISPTTVIVPSNIEEKLDQ